MNTLHKFTVDSLNRTFSSKVDRKRLVPYEIIKRISKNLVAIEKFILKQILTGRVVISLPTSYTSLSQFRTPPPPQLVINLERYLLWVVYK